MKIVYQVVMVTARVILKLGLPTTDRGRAEYCADVASRVTGREIHVADDRGEVVYTSKETTAPVPGLPELVTGVWT